jgi:hypothetical protein
LNDAFIIAAAFAAVSSLDGVVAHRSTTAAASPQREHFARMSFLIAIAGASNAAPLALRAVSQRDRRVEP